ncbi:hypothetical protein F4680DRAFT_404555 [Xylaria scruposa]|nr:hypothetical protein F4680DRAFT_404555 [Xylaria scruposa]
MVFGCWRARCIVTILASLLASYSKDRESQMQACFTLTPYQMLGNMSFVCCTRHFRAADTKGGCIIADHCEVDNNNVS